MNNQRNQDRKRLWWIASYPKSGSTWVRMVLNAYVTGFPPDINSAWQYATGDLQAAMYQLTAAQQIGRLCDTDYAYYRPAVLLNYILSSPTTDRALKTHHAKVELDGIPLIPPRLSKGALYIIRDPRDVAVSFADHMGVSINDAIDKMANNGLMLCQPGAELSHVLLSWSSHVDSWTVHNKGDQAVPTSVVRYEDMMGTPAKTWPLVMQALGIDPDPERLAVALERTAFARLQEQEQERGFREKGNGKAFFREGKVGGWRTVLTRKQQTQIEDNHRQTMRRWGYLKQGNANVLGRVQIQATATVSDKE